MNYAVKSGIPCGDIVSQPLYLLLLFDIANIDVRTGKNSGNVFLYLPGLNNIDYPRLRLGKDLAYRKRDALLVGYPENKECFIGDV